MKRQGFAAPDNPFVSRMRRKFGRKGSEYACCDDSDADDEAPLDQEAVATDDMVESRASKVTQTFEVAGCCGDPSSKDEVSSEQDKEKLVKDFSKKVIDFAKTIIHYAIMEGLDESPGGFLALDMFEANLKSFTDDLGLF